METKMPHSGSRAISPRCGAAEWEAARLPPEVRMWTRDELKRDPRLRAIALRNSARMTNSRMSRRKLPILGQTAFHFRGMPRNQIPRHLAPPPGAGNRIKALRGFPLPAQQQCVPLVAPGQGYWDSASANGPMLFARPRHRAGHPGSRQWNSAS